MKTTPQNISDKAKCYLRKQKRTWKDNSLIRSDLIKILSTNQKLHKTLLTLRKQEGMEA